MKIKLQQKSLRNKELIKKAICYDKLTAFLGAKKTFKIMEVGIDKSEVFLKIKNTQNQEICHLGLSPFINNQNFLDFKNKLFIYARTSAFLINRKVNQLILKIIYVNLAANDLLAEQILALINQEASREIEAKINKTGRNKIKFLKFFRQLTLPAIQRFWPFIVNFKYIGFNLLEADSGGRFYLILKDNQNKHYFLKIYLDNDDSAKDIGRSMLFLNKFLTEKINTPKIIAVQEGIKIGGLKTLWVLYDFVNKDSRIGWPNIAKVAVQAAKLHQLNLDDLKSKLPAAFFSNAWIDELKRHKFRTKSLSLSKNSQNFLDESLEYLKQASSVKGLCHFDLEERNVFINNSQVYLIDFDASRVDDLFFDLAMLLNDFIRKGKTDIIPVFLRTYFELNKTVTCNLDYLRSASAFVAVLNCSKKEINEQFIKIQEFYKNLWL